MSLRFLLTLNLEGSGLVCILKCLFVFSDIDVRIKFVLLSYV